MMSFDELAPLPNQFNKSFRRIDERQHSQAGSILIIFTTEIKSSGFKIGDKKHKINLDKQIKGDVLTFKERKGKINDMKNDARY